MLGEIALEAGDVAGARARFARALEVCRAPETSATRRLRCGGWGKRIIAAGDLELARTRLDAALRALEAFEMNAEVLGCLEDHASLAHARGRADDAARLYAAAACQREQLNLTRAAARRAAMAR